MPWGGCARFRLVLVPIIGSFMFALGCASVKDPDRASLVTTSSDRSVDTTVAAPSVPTVPPGAGDVVLAHPDFVLPVGYAAPQMVAGYYVVADITLAAAMEVARAAGFTAALVDDGEARWRVTEGNRVFQIERRFGKRRLFVSEKPGERDRAVEHQRHQ